MTVLEISGSSLAAIAVMGAVTWLMRAGGYWLMGYVPLTPRVRRMLEALPGAIVVAIVLPLIVKAGVFAGLAIVASVAVMVATRNALLAIAAGVGVAALARSVAI